MGYQPVFAPIMSHWQRRLQIFAVYFDWSAEKEEEKKIKVALLKEMEKGNKIVENLEKEIAKLEAENSEIAKLVTEN